MSKKTRTPRGSVAIANQEGMLRLRWRINGQRYQMALGLPDSPLNRNFARAKAAEIEGDIAMMRFDPTLAKYKPQPTIQEIRSEPPATTALFKEFMDWRRSQGTGAYTLTSRYAPLLSNLERWKENIATASDAQRFVAKILAPRQSATSINSNLPLLKSFGEWAIRNGHMESNPFADLPRHKAIRDRSTRKPFSLDEVRKILQTAKFHPHYSSYHDFIATLLFLGLRPSEAIGLRWQDVDLQRAEVQITGALARNPDGRTAGYARQRKGTKTGDSGNRTLALVPELVAMLQGRKPIDGNPSDLVFIGPRGKPIDDHSFSQRAWKQILKDAGVAHRPPYACRHTALSYIIEAGGTLTQAAYVAGHSNTRMIAETYGHAINRPQMPRFTI